MSKILLAPLQKPFNSRTSKNPLVNLNFHPVVVVVIAVVDITCMGYFFKYFFLVLLKYLKTYGNGLNLSIIHFWLITGVSTLSLYAHVIAIKMGVSCMYAYSLFVWDSRDIRGLYFSNFSLEKYILVKM